MLFKSALLSLLLAVALPAQALAAASERHLVYDGRDRTYEMFVPELAEGPRPLVVLLHGTGSDGAFMLAQWKDIAARKGLILLAPNDLRSNHGWDLRTDGPDYIHAVIVAAGQAIDTRRMYLFGQSGGAVYALNLAMLESQFFAAVAFHAGGWRHPDEFKFMGLASRKVPVLISVGDQDEYFSQGAVRQTARALEDAGFPVELDMLEGRHHSYLDIPPDFHDHVWDFLSRNALDDAPVFVSFGGAGQ